MEGACRTSRAAIWLARGDGSTRRWSEAHAGTELARPAKDRAVAQPGARTSEAHALARRGRRRGRRRRLRTSSSRPGGRSASSSRTSAPTRAWIFVDLAADGRASSRRSAEAAGLDAVARGGPPRVCPATSSARRRPTREIGSRAGRGVRAAAGRRAFVARRSTSRGRRAAQARAAGVRAARRDALDRRRRGAARRGQPEPQRLNAVSWWPRFCQSSMPPCSTGRARDALGGEHARGHAGAGAARADRDHRPAVVELVAEGAHEPVRDVPAARDVALVALVLLAHVEHLGRVVCEQRLELVDADRLDPLRRLELEHVAGDVEQADRVQASARPRPLRSAEEAWIVIGSSWSSTKAGLRPDRGAVERDVDRAVDVARPRARRRAGRRAAGLAARRAARAAAARPRNGPRFSATTRSTVGGRGAEIAAECATNSCRSPIASAWLRQPLRADRRGLVAARARRRRASRRCGRGRPRSSSGSSASRRSEREEILGALARLDREVGPRRVADQQRVAGQQVAFDEEAAVLGPVAGRVHHADRQRADRELVRRPRAARAGTRPRRAGGSRRARRARARGGRARRRGRRGCASRARARSARPPARPPRGRARSRRRGRSTTASPAVSSPIR